jgi:hypothetical protein
MSKNKKDPAADFFRRDALRQNMTLKDYCDKYGIDYWELVGKKRPEISIDQSTKTQGI